MPVPSALRSTALVLALGLSALWLSSLQSFPRLSWSDEVVYAVMGRNIAGGRGAISNFYDVLSILRKGFPLGDVHMPGHAFLLALSFRALGPSELAAFLPGGIAFLLTGLLLFDVGRRAFDEGVGLTAAVLFYLSPPMTAFAHTAMPELPLVLLATAYFAVWCRAWEGASVGLAVAMALLLGSGATFRETLLVFVPSAAYVLWRRPRPEGLRALLLFGLAFSAYLMLALMPLASSRAPYPNFLSTITDLGNGAAIGRAVAANAVRNLTGLPHPGGHCSGWTFTWLYVTGVFLPLFLLRRPGTEGRVAALVFASFVASVVALAGVYPLRDLGGGMAPAAALTRLPATWWGGVRALMFLSPPATLLLAVVLARIRSLPLRRAALGLVGGLLIFLSVRANAALAADRIGAYRYDQLVSRVVAATTAGLRPRSVIAEWAFLYGWESYPVTVIWRATAQPAEIAALERILPVDVILIGEIRKAAIENAVRTGAVTGGYRLLAQPSPGVYVFASAACLERARPSQASSQP